VNVVKLFLFFCLYRKLSIVPENVFTDSGIITGKAILKNNANVVKILECIHIEKMLLHFVQDHAPLNTGDTEQKVINVLMVQSPR